MRAPSLCSIAIGEWSRVVCLCLDGVAVWSAAEPALGTHVIAEASRSLVR